MNPLSFIQELVMLAILLIGALGAALVTYLAARDVAHSIPRANDDLIFI